MTTRPIPPRHWRSYGDDPLPTGAEALDEPFRAFPSWFMRVTCDRCGKDRMLNEAHAAQGDMLIRDILKRMRHDGCGGRARTRRVAHRHRGRQQPAGAQDRAARVTRRPRLHLWRRPADTAHRSPQRLYPRAGVFLQLLPPPGGRRLQLLVAARLRKNAAN